MVICGCLAQCRWRTIISWCKCDPITREIGSLFWGLPSIFHLAMPQPFCLCVNMKNMILRIWTHQEQRNWQVVNLLAWLEHNVMQNVYYILLLSHLSQHVGCRWPGTLTHWGWDEMNNISRTTFWNVFSSMKMFEFSFKFRWSLFPRVQLTIFQHWFR